LLKELNQVTEEITRDFSTMFEAYTLENSKKYKAVISKRNLVNKIIQRIEGLIRSPDCDMDAGKDQAKIE
jgi:hypothetical protein